MQTDIEVYSNAEQLAKAFQDLGGYIKKSPEIQAAFKQASKYLISKGRARLRSRSNGYDVSSTSKSMTYQLYKNKKGSLVGFEVKPSSDHREMKWAAMRPIIFNSGTVERHSSKGYRGRIKPTHFWTDTNEQDTPTAMNMITDSIRQSINKIMNR